MTNCNGGISMAQPSRITISPYIYSELFAEVEGLCPLCLSELLTTKNNRYSNQGQAAHIYPHSPSEEELISLANVPMLADTPESINNLILLCPSCHTKFDHPRTREEYMQLYALKDQLIRRKTARKHYSNHSLENDLIALLNCIDTIDTEIDSKKLSYNVMTVRNKMYGKASNSLIQVVLRNVRDYYLPIRDALIQLEHDTPGKSDLIAKQIGLFYSKLNVEGFSLDEIYYSINEWLDFRTNQKYKLLTPLITAFYIQNCEVFSL